MIPLFPAWRLCWAAVTGEVGTASLMLYAAGIAWTLFYDTIYAHQDTEDDELVAAIGGGDDLVVDGAACAEPNTTRKSS